MKRNKKVVLRQSAPERHPSSRFQTGKWMAEPNCKHEKCSGSDMENS